MDPYLLLKGIAVGILVSVPVGPVSLLVIQRTLESGRRRTGLMTGLGAALADGFYAWIAIGGLLLVGDVLLLESPWTFLIVAPAVVLMGLRAMRRVPRVAAKRMAAHELPSWGGAIASGLMLTLFNPMAVLAMLVLFTTLAITPGITGFDVVPGVIGGAMAWWAGLTLGIHRLHRDLGEATLRRFNKVCGWALIAVGVYAGARGAWMLGGQPPLL